MSTVSHWLPPGAFIPWHFILVTKVCKMGFGSQADPLAKTRRSWHLEVRLEFIEVAGEGGGIWMVRHTSAVLQTPLLSSLLALCEASVPHL